MKNITSKLLIFIAILTVSFSAVYAQKGGLDNMQLEKKIRKEILMLPYYDVFDFVKFNLSNDGTVTLSGQVNEYSTQKGAVSSVKRLAGVSKVVNNIEVLPLSNFDDQLRQRVYYSIASKGALGGYLQETNPDMHIIVRNGNVTLEGFVRNSSDANLAKLAANSVSGVFSVTNNLISEKNRLQ
jgi:hyperosmotically inducible protein